MDLKTVLALALLVFLQIGQTFGARCSYTLSTALCEDVNNIRDVSGQFRTNWLRIIIRNKPDTTLTIPERDNNVGRVEELDLSGTHYLVLSQHGFRAFSGLRRLIVRNTSLTELNDAWFDGNNDLEYIDISVNDLKSLQRENLRKLKRLRYISFFDNNIESIEINAFIDLARLDTLNLNNNRMGSIVDIGSLPRLRHLDIAENYITDVPNNIFSKSPSLETINLAQNNIQRIRDRSFAGLHNLRTLNISSNNLRQLSANSFTSASLQTLDLSKNDLESLKPNTFAQLESLQILNLSRNNLRELNGESFRGLVSLKILNLDVNNLLNLQAGTFNIPPLERLDLSENDLQTFSGDVFGESELRLRILYLRNNKLGVVQPNTFSQTPHLEYLSVAHNMIQSFDENIFTNIRLRKLHIQHNMIEELPPRLYNNLSTLTELLIDHNRLTFLPDTDTEFKNLQKVTVEGNPWQCPCLSEIFTFITAFKIDYRAKDNPFYQGARPLCITTPVSYCVKDVQLARQHKILELYQSAYSQS